MTDRALGTLPLRERLGCIARRELDDRTLTPGEALDLVELYDVANDVLDWLARCGYTDATNIDWNLRRKLEDIGG